MHEQNTIDHNNVPDNSGSSKKNKTQGVTTTIPEIEKYRIERAYRLGLIGFLATIGLSLLLAGLTMRGFKEAQAVSNIVSPFLAVLGTLVGAFFGIQVGSAGREELSQQVQDANNRATAFAGSANPDALQKAVDAYTRLSRK